jgi:uncharacterized ubiquitin-like protein YukD
MTDPWKEVMDPNTNQPYYYNVHTNETSWTRPAMPVLKFTVTTISGKTFNLELEASKTVADVKSRIASQDTTLSMEKIRLLAKGKELENNRTLEDAEVSDGDNLHLVIKLGSTTDPSNRSGVTQPRPPATSGTGTGGGASEFSVTVPSNSGPGQVMTVNVPSVGLMQVPIPQGCYPGQTFRFRVPAPAQPQAQMQLMEIICPPHGAPGSSIEVQLPNGQRASVIVPPNARPGQPFRFQYQQ